MKDEPFLQDHPSKLNSSRSGLIRDFTNALGQQLYFWGRDVIHPDGNLLCEYGLERSKSEGLDKTSCYRMRFKGDLIELHGVCVGLYSSKHPSFLFTRFPRRCYIYDDHEPPPPGFYSRGLMNCGPPDKLEEACQRFLVWWLAYESWIEVRTDRKYRDRCYRAFGKLPKSKPWLPPSQALKWLQGYREAPETHTRARTWKNQATTMA